MSNKKEQIEALEREALQVLERGQKDEQIDALLALNILRTLAGDSASAADLKVAMDYLKFRGYTPTSARHLSRGKGEGADQGGPRLEDLLDMDALPPGVLDEHPADAALRT